ncbi:hypothetical protein SRHO_G00140300 [Serrasalmus rhombeus]
MLEVPKSVDHLKILLEEKLELKKDFELQFEGPDFDNALFNLHSIDELPAEKAILKEWTWFLIHLLNTEPELLVATSIVNHMYLLRKQMLRTTTPKIGKVAAATSLPEVTNIVMILDEAVVLRDIVDLSTAFAYLFGLLYAINMEFPQELKRTFEAIQKIFMDLGGSYSARVQSLKIKLC